MEKTKRASVANFNLVFYGKEEEPLLSHFDDIVMPAFQSNVKRTSEDCKYFLMDVAVEETQDREYVLKGLLVKETILEVKSNIDENGNLVPKDERYPTAPFSFFVIYLRNHRMLFVQNQKGSPSLKNFRATAQNLLNKYMDQNSEKLIEKFGTLPIPILNVVGIPMRQKMEEALAKVDRINMLCLRFYPLNGDLDYGDIFGYISQKIRRKAGSKKADLLLKSPNDTNGVIELVEKSSGTVDPIFEVTYKDEDTGKKKKTTIRNNEISESMQLKIDDGTVDQSMEQIVKQGKKIGSITYVSEVNNIIYNDNESKIIKFIPKR